MPPSKPKPSEIAADAKRNWLPYIWKHYVTNAKTSYAYPDSSVIRVSANKRSRNRTRVAVLEGDPVTHAMGWYQSAIRDPAYKNCKRIPVVNMANERRAGGDWESGLMAPEECFARRSNLVHALTMPWNAQMGKDENHYPIPQRGGIYCPEVYVFRGGPDMDYAIFQNIEKLPVISVAPVRGPRLNESGSSYSFEQERELMKEKMRTVLRIAAYCDHRNLVIGAFGLGPIFRNPAREVAKMWRHLLYEEEEFRGVFTDVVFAIDCSMVGPPAKTGVSDVDIFREEFDPSAIFPTQYGWG
ncbi:hypothetical protein DPSP01_005223 [Paraphaeosphaeria sporulosa]|uniref:Microbial-type PARG catalytic domain-containing protein n=1 Tax=Paraphaeosphaeria sporulosa TaxID=1460663 RepID=A0A177BWW8_9PLEO|nr:uncharacterized protein CC84DRAFT_1130810 [Paraphaeosphaeria sporulosa]OAF99804.1 hypothetical protein CC84DRAFT_1130810 [Paraphaeosphaeria sporulosa]